MDVRRYRLAVDVGAVTTTAAVGDAGTAAPVTLGRAGSAGSSALLVRDDELLVGEDAERVARSGAGSAVRGWVQSIGDRLGVLVGGEWVHAHDLLAATVEAVLRRVGDNRWQPPEELVVAHPARWTAEQRTLVVEALSARLDLPVRCIAAPVAAVLHHTGGAPLDEGCVVAVVDVGGRTIETALVAGRAAGPTPVGAPRSWTRDVDGGPRESAQVVAAVRGSLRDLAIGPEELEAVLFVGGGARDARLARHVADELGAPVRTGTEPEMSVALGAAAGSRGRSFEPAGAAAMAPAVALVADEGHAVVDAPQGVEERTVDEQGTPEQRPTEQPSPAPGAHDDPPGGTGPGAVLVLPDDPAGSTELVLRDPVPARAPAGVDVDRAVPSEGAPLPGPSRLRVAAPALLGVVAVAGVLALALAVLGDPDDGGSEPLVLLPPTTSTSPTGTTSTAATEAGAASTAPTTVAEVLALTGPVAVVDLAGPERRILVRDDDGSTTDVSEGLAAPLGPSVAPGGDRVAFTAARGGGQRLFVSAIGGLLGPLELDTGPGTASTPAWSPDGTRIAFSHADGGQRTIRVIDPDTGQVVAVTEGDVDDRAPTWSPDGARIAFHRQTTDDDGQVAASVLLVPSDGSDAPRPLAAGQDVWRGPSWSPDGTQVAVRAGRADSSILLVDVADGTRSILRPDRGRALASPDWTGAGILLVEGLDDPMVVAVADDASWAVELFPGASPAGPVGAG